MWSSSLFEFYVRPLKFLSIKKGPGSIYKNVSMYVISIGEWKLQTFLDQQSQLRSFYFVQSDYNVVRRWLLSSSPSPPPPPSLWHSTCCCCCQGHYLFGPTVQGVWCSICRYPGVVSGVGLGPLPARLVAHVTYHGAGVRTSREGRTRRLYEARRDVQIFCHYFTLYERGFTQIFFTVRVKLSLEMYFCSCFFRLCTYMFCFLFLLRLSILTFVIDVCFYR